MPSNAQDLNWRRPCTGGNCVEVAVTPAMIYVRDSKDPQDGRYLTFTPETWRMFLHQVKAGEFDLPAC
jgi:hypothetical protein